MSFLLKTFRELDRSIRDLLLRCLDQFDVFCLDDLVGFLPFCFSLLVFPVDPLPGKDHGAFKFG